jgi:hypothetical protein
MEDARQQGFIAYMTYLGDQNPKERKLMRLVQRSGGMLLPSTGTFAFGTTERRH